MVPPPDDAPVPLNETVVGEFVALLVTVTEPVRVPVAVGVNVTLIVHDAPAAIELPQLFDCVKSPDAPIDDTAADTVPLLCTVTACALLVVPTFWLANDTLDGDADSDAEPPPPPLPLPG